MTLLSTSGCKEVRFLRPTYEYNRRFFSLLRRVFFSLESVVTTVNRCRGVMENRFLSPVPTALPPAVIERVAGPGPGASVEGGRLGCFLAIPPPILVRPGAGL